MYRKILRFSFVCYALQWILFQQILKQSLNSTNTCYSNSSCVLNCENVGDKVQDLLKAVLPSKLLFDKLHNPSMQKFENRRFWTLWICLQEVRRLIFSLFFFLQQTGFMDMKEKKKITQGTNQKEGSQNSSTASWNLQKSLLLLVH